MTSPQAIARMVERATRKAAVGRARSAQVRFDGVGIPDLITFPDGSSTPPIFVTHTATLMPGGASPAGMTLPMLVVPLDGGGWVPVAYMPDQAEYLVATTLDVPVHTVWIKGSTWSGTWQYQEAFSTPAAYALQGFHVLGGSSDYLIAASVLYFGDVPSMIPSGAIVHSVQFALTRVTGVGTQLPGAPEHLGPTAPWVSAHSYTPSSPPVSTQPPALSLSTRWAEMRPGGTQQGDVWATGLLSGAIKGVAIGGPTETGTAAFSDLRLLITYTGGAPSE